MSAPSELHEMRVRQLETMATLGGYTRDVQVYRGERPDLARLNMTHLGLLLGDAKASEGPMDHRSQARLHAYLVSAQLWLRAGFTASLVICHGADPTASWGTVLRRLGQATGGRVTSVTVTRVDSLSWVTTVSLRDSIGLSPHRHEGRIAG